MAFKQPRVPEFNEKDGVSRYLKTLVLFLKDFCQEAWVANRQSAKSMPEIDYPVISVNGKTGDVELDVQDIADAASTKQINQLSQQLATVDNAKLAKTEQAADSAKLNGKAPQYYLQPRNLLDNSDFRNSVNQRGQTSYTGVKYTIDRWRAYHADTTHEITTSGIHVSSTGVNPNLYQHINSAGLDMSKKYTAVACDSDGNVYTWSGLLTNTVGEAPICVYVTEKNSTFRLSKADTTWVWAALYEGEYTADNLPPYVSKGYGIELAECLGYFRRFGNPKSKATTHIGMGMAATTTVANVVLELGIPLRSPSPSISYTGTVYLRYGTTDVAVSALSMNYQSCGQTYFAATSSSLTAGRVYALRLYNGACIDISADL